MAQFKFAQPAFEEVLVEDNLKDGYWLDAVDIDGDGRLDLIACGLAEGELVWYQNRSPSWIKHSIGAFPKPVAMDHAPLVNGRPDLVVCHDYGTCMFACKPEDGKISWLQHPGGDGTGPWQRHYIANLVATHRLRFGSFTRAGARELMALPVVGPKGGPEAVHQPVQVMLYTPQPDKLDEPWPAAVVDDKSFRVIHDVVVGKFAEKDRNAALDSVLLATEEGVCWVHHQDGAWRTEILGTGEQTEVGLTGFKGTGNLGVGRVGSDPYAYIATLEPFHGNTLAVYTKPPGRDGLKGPWRRTILDVFGDPNDAGEGAGHHVMTADFDGDGDDEFLMALRGPWPWQGVFYYKCIDVENAVFTKKRVSNASAARIALGDFDGDGRIDFATTGYYTPGYFLCDRPQVLVFLNRIEPGSA
jgi:hypothetical protein